MVMVLATLQQGLQLPEHHAFVQQLREQIPQDFAQRSPETPQETV